MILSAKRLITGDGKTVLENGAVLVRDGLIHEVGDSVKLRAAHSGEEMTDYGDAALLPGLIDMHVHIGYWHNHRDRDLYDKYIVGFIALNFVKSALKNGVTTMRDVANADGVCKSLIYAQKKGLVEIPRIIHCNRAICATGGHFWNSWDVSVEADGTDEIRKAVRAQIKAGAKWIKIMTSHRSPGVSEYTQEELDAAVDEARRHLARVAVHASIQPSLELSINAGFDTIEHGCCITEAQAKRMIEKGMTLVPTLLVHKTLYGEIQDVIDKGLSHTLTETQWETYRIYGESIELYRKNIKLFADMGLNIVGGTDMITEYAAPAPMADELAVMVEYGIEPIKAIAAGTSVSARVLGMEGEIGILAKGAQADILVVEGDPSGKIADLKNVMAVYFGGKIVD